MFSSGPLCLVKNSGQAENMNRLQKFSFEYLRQVVTFLPCSSNPIKKIKNKNEKKLRSKLKKYQDFKKSQIMSKN